MTVDDLGTHGWPLDPDAPARRHPPRPLDKREPRYDELFDFDTVFFDVFHSDAGDAVIAAGPPPFNLAPALEEASYSAAGQTLEIARRQLIDRHFHMRLSPAPGADALTVSGPLGQVNIRIDRNRSDLFEGRRVLLTQSRDNNPVWIRDWVEFNIHYHGVDAVLFYDNNSTIYTQAALHEMLSAISGLAVVAVVGWPYKWGPTSVGLRIWDSNFGQIGSWEHARWKYLQRARSVLVSDIDELVLTENNRSILHMAENASHGLVCYKGSWMPTIRGVSDRLETPRHRDYRIRNKIGVNDSPGKWAVVPQKTPAGAQWSTHNVPRMRNDPDLAQKARYRHFRGINHNWKWNRRGSSIFNPEMHEDDHQFAEVADRIFKN